MKRSTQQGSAHVVIVVVLVIALLGALGYIFYQNLAGKKDQARQSVGSNQQSPSSTTDKTGTVDASNTDVADSNANKDTTDDTTSEKAEKPSGQPDDGYFAIAPWKIQIKEADGAYVYWSTSGDTLSFTSKAVKAIGGDCAKSDYALVYLTRAKTSTLVMGAGITKQPINSKAINGYFYFLGNAQYPCNSNPKDDATVIHDMQSLKKAASTIKALN